MKQFIAIQKSAAAGDKIKDISKIVDLDRMLALLKSEKVIGEKDTWDKIPFYRPKKSDESDDGYSGRIGIHEILKVTSSIKELIVGGNTQDEIEAQARKAGLAIMLEDGFRANLS